MFSSEREMAVCNNGMTAATPLFQRLSLRHLFAAFACVLALTSGLFPTDAQAATISGTQLTTVETTADLRSNVRHNGQQQVYGDAAYGTFIAVDDGTAQTSWPLFQPTNISSMAVTGATALTAGTQVTSGSGTAADPWKIVTSDVLAGSTGISITQTDTLIDPNEFYQTEIVVTNNSADDKTIILYRAMDCFLGATDRGFGMISGNTVGCVRRDTATLPANSTDPTQPISRVEQFLDLTGTAKREVGQYSAHIRNAIQVRREYTNVCMPNCDTYQDNGMGLSWMVTIPAGESLTFSHYTLFSPLGIFPLTTAATVAPAIPLQGGTVTYTVTLANPNTAPVDALTVSFKLPAGFSFVTGSSVSGFPQPVVGSGNTLTWTGSVAVPANNGTITITFDATVGASVPPGTYRSDVSGTADGGHTVMPSLATAPVRVELRARDITTASVPTLSQWGMIALIGLLGLCATIAKTRRRV